MGNNAIDNKPTLVYHNAAVAADVDEAVGADSNLVLLGYTYAETTGTPAVFEFMIVNGATGAAAGKVASAGGRVSGGGGIWFGERGIPCPLGISVDFVVGTINLTIYYKVLDNG
jgi:hypothetical protein|tara:strand:+ start:89 stop:430 length:342 start_codon:yes stop_codon:yes gene_type:complete